MKLIDAEKIPWQTTETIGDDPIEVQLIFKQSIDIMPAIEIVRCKECKWRGQYFYCPIPYKTYDNFFCRSGEKKTE